MNSCVSVWEWDKPACSGSTEGSRSPPVADRPGGTAAGPDACCEAPPTSVQGRGMGREWPPVRGQGQG